MHISKSILLLMLNIDNKSNLMLQKDISFFLSCKWKFVIKHTSLTGKNTG